MKKPVLASSRAEGSGWTSRRKFLNVKNFHCERQEVNLLTSGNFAANVERFWCERQEKMELSFGKFFIWLLVNFFYTTAVIIRHFYFLYETPMKFKLVEKANPMDRTKKKRYANAVNAGTMSQKEMARLLEEKSSLTIGDISNVIENLIVELPRQLMEGKSVKLGDFGSFRLSLSSEGAEDKKKFNTAKIEPKVIFTPSTEFKEKLQKISYTQAE